MKRMNRRTFLKATVHGAAAVGGYAFLATPAAGAFRNFDEAYFARLRRFNEDHVADTRLDEGEMDQLKNVTRHLKRVQSMIGYGNFGVVSFDDMLQIGKDYSRVGSFDHSEMEFFERIFHEEASRYGFFGEKLLSCIADEVPVKDLFKVPKTGQFLYQGRPLDKYREIRNCIGDDVILTSGVRGVVKQMSLFLNKAVSVDGNLSRASRSVAPPGYSFHGVGDFDVGKRGLGRANFTRAFAETDVYKRLVDQGFATLRYPEDNLKGVRYEPWHIRVV